MLVRRERDGAPVLRRLLGCGPSGAGTGIHCRLALPSLRPCVADGQEARQDENKRATGSRRDRVCIRRLVGLRVDAALGWKIGRPAAVVGHHYRRHGPSALLRVDGRSLLRRIGSRQGDFRPGSRRRSDIGEHAGIEGRPGPPLPGRRGQAPRGPMARPAPRRKRQAGITRDRRRSGLAVPAHGAGRDPRCPRRRHRQAARCAAHGGTAEPAGETRRRQSAHRHDGGEGRGRTRRRLPVPPATAWR